MHKVPPEMYSKIKWKQLTGAPLSAEGGLPAEPSTDMAEFRI